MKSVFKSLKVCCSFVIFFCLFHGSIALSKKSSSFKIQERAELDFNLVNQYLTAEDIKFKHGPYAGQSIDQTKHRPIVFISELETYKNFYFLNFYNQGHFWLAEMDKQTLVESVVFQLAHFKSGVGLMLSHAQLRFQLAKPINLYRSKNGQLVSTQTSDLIFSIQAALPRGAQYNMIDAVSGNYQVVSRLLNTYDRVFLEEIPDGDIVTQYKMRSLSNVQKSKLLFNSIQFSSDTLFNKKYFATNANCVNLLMDIIDQTLKFSKPRIELDLENMLVNGISPIEKMTLDALLERNLIDEKSRIENLKIR